MRHPHGVVEDVLQLPFVLMLKEVVEYDPCVVSVVLPLPRILLVAPVGVEYPLGYRRHQDLCAEVFELRYDVFIAETVAPDVYLADHAYKRARPVWMRVNPAECVPCGLQLRVRELLYADGVAYLIDALPVYPLTLALDLLVRPHLTELLFEYVAGHYAPPREAREVAACGGKLPVEVAVLIRRVDRHVLEAKLVEHQPVVPVVLAEPARPVAGWHEKRAPFRVKPLGLHGLYHVSGGEYGRVTFASGGVSFAELQRLLVRHGHDHGINAARLECRGHRMNAVGHIRQVELLFDVRPLENSLFPVVGTYPALDVLDAVKECLAARYGPGVSGVLVYLKLKKGFSEGGVLVKMRNERIRAAAEVRDVHRVEPVVVPRELCRGQNPLAALPVHVLGERLVNHAVNRKHVIRNGYSAHCPEFLRQFQIQP